MVTWAPVSITAVRGSARTSIGTCMENPFVQEHDLTATSLTQGGTGFGLDPCSQGNVSGGRGL